MSTHTAVTGSRVVGERGIESPQCVRCGIDRDRELSYKYGPYCADCRAVIEDRPVRGRVAHHEAA
jgi:hypothetical protein